jgi:hypothetical protein
MLPVPSDNQNFRKLPENRFEFVSVFYVPYCALACPPQSVVKEPLPKLNKCFFTVIRTQLLLCREWKPKVPHPDLVKMHDVTRYDRCDTTVANPGPGMVLLNTVCGCDSNVKVPENRLADSVTVLVVLHIQSRYRCLNFFFFQLP